MGAAILEMGVGPVVALMNEEMPERTATSMSKMEIQLKLTPMQ